MTIRCQSTLLARGFLAGFFLWVAVAPNQGAASESSAIVAKAADEVANHWAFKPPVPPAIPSAHNAKFEIRNPIDAFVARKHAELGLVPSPEADRRTLIRRASLDLLGLPPTPQEVEEFLADHSPNAYESLVERLLASSHYGERWGRFWLDLARWAESDGFEANEIRSTAWRYRDYVVKAFNDDKPYDRFLREQIAGDELEPYSDENLVATGFLAAARNNNNEEDKAVQFNEPLVDIANTVASVTLGLTLGCAQCHDHKFEPLTIRDYYSWQGFFVRGQINSLLLKDQALWTEWKKSRPAELDATRKSLKALVEPVRAWLREAARVGLSDDQRVALEVDVAERTPEQQALAEAATKALAITDAQVKAVLGTNEFKAFEELSSKAKRLEEDWNRQRPNVWGFYSPATSPHRIDHLPPRGMYPFPYKPEVLKTNQPVVLKRGDIHRPGEAVEPAVPVVLFASTGLKAPPGSKFRTRSQLANWLASDASPLTARVWVNFVWQQHFGRGLVETPGDFGVKGAKPSNQLLLDWLACELRAPEFRIEEPKRPWSTKHLHRLILLSSTYRQSSQPNDADASVDPENRFLWRWWPRRLEGEAIHDSLLAVSGRLDRALGGPSTNAAKAKLPPVRRALYLTQRRYSLPASLSLFDAPVSNDSCPRRHSSTVPLQPLYLLNNEASQKNATAFAARVLHRAGPDQTKQIDAAFLLALQRSPDAAEKAAAAEFFEKAAASSTNAGTSDPPRVLVQFCQSLLNANEFVYLQ